MHMNTSFGLLNPFPLVSLVDSNIGGFPAVKDLILIIDLLLSK